MPRCRRGGLAVAGRRWRLLILLLAAWCWAAPGQASELDAAAPEVLIEVLKANVYLTGDIVRRMEAQDRLARLGRQDPAAVVPLVVAELAPPRSYGKIAGHQRLALIELLRDIGPAAEAAVPRLAEILSDAEEPYESVRTQSAAALTAIGTPEAKAAAEAYFAGLNAQFAESASPREAERSAAQSAFLIRQELRSRAPSDGVIGASAGSLRALGSKASSAQPTLLRAYNDARLSPSLREDIADTLEATGVSDVAAAAAEAAQTPVPDILDEVIEETRNEDSLVRSLAMGELGRLGPSKAAADALIEALREGRSPGDAARVLGDFGRLAVPALPDLARYFDDDQAGDNAIQAAGKIGAKDPQIVAALRRILATPGHRHRGMAASALGELEAADALPELQQALAVGGKYERILAAQALGKLEGEAAPAVEALAASLADPDLDLRRAAVEALGRIGEAARPAAPAIAEQLDGSDGRLATAAQTALAAIGGAEADAALDRDAARFLEADLAEARHTAATGGLEGVSEYLFDLPERRALALGHRLVSMEEPDSALAGAIFLAFRGEIEPAVPVLADSLARREDSEELLTGLVWAMMHGGDEARIAPLFESLLRFLQDNRERYSADERARLKALFKQALPVE